MASTQTRVHKTKPTPKAAAAGTAAGRKKGNAEAKPDAGPTLTAQERQLLIARAAYFRAEKRGFAPGAELQDWIEAEAEVRRLIGGS